MTRLKKLFRDNFYLILLLGVILSFFYPAIFQGKIPIPADTIVGMYHPWRDKVWDNFTSGVPFKNFLITDPVRQQYVWRNLAISEFKKGNLPLWNPYSFSGTPLLANFQSAPFYPLNILFFILPFNLAWTILVILQPLLSGIFLFLYLREIRISKAASFLGGLTFAFCGFSVSWLEWNTVLATALWLPLILLSIHKVIQHLKNKKSIIWSLIFIFSLASSFFAGHLQIFFYSFSIVILYTIAKVITLTKNRLKAIFLFSILYFLFVLVTSIQWVPTLQFIASSARDFDQGSFAKEGWFIPWQNLIQFLSPDFFGNPSTGNYWGVWNYAEFAGYVGIAPLLFALYALIFRRDKKTLFFGSFAVLSLIFALPTPLAKLPYEFKLPLISTSQPTRLLFLTDFALSVLTAFGADYLTKQKNSMRQVIKLLVGAGIIYGILWFFVLSSDHFGISTLEENILIARRNLVLPTIIMFLITILFVSFSVFNKKKRFASLLYSIVIIITVVELFRSGWKFTPFTSENWLFPKTQITEILREQNDYSRIMAVDRRIMPPNFSSFYQLPDVAGYDPLYLKNYGQLAAAWGRNEPDISTASFNRIITPVSFESFIADLLGVKFVMSLSLLESSKLQYLTSEGETRLYSNKDAFPRAFFVENIVKTKNEQEEIEKMFELKEKLRTTAVSAEEINIVSGKLQVTEEVHIISYSPGHIVIQASADAGRLLVLTDTYYPSWKAFVDGSETKVYKVDFALRAVVVPSGKHTVEFKNNLL